MLLAELLDGVSVTKLFVTMYGKMAITQDVVINRLHYDSRLVEHGDVFVAIPGTSVDGHLFIDNAIAQGARAVVVEHDAARPDALFMHANVAKIVVPNARIALARMAANCYRHPSRHLQLIGVTGTNGKTTTSYLIKSILESAGHRVGLIGTIAYTIGDEVLPATHTTPESLEINMLLDRMVQSGCTAVVMEVSSHALALHRVHGLRFAVGVFTNLTQDHLDFHGTMEEYFKAKRLLFLDLEEDATAVTNADDPGGRAIVEGICAKTFSYSMTGAADVTARNISMNVRGITMDVVCADTSVTVQSTLTGRFNVANILAASSASMALAIPSDTMVEGIRRVKAVRGRFEQIPSPQGWTAIIDYAHTPDALQNVLSTIRALLAESSKGKIITVFGCGGNRDKDKRPKMGRIASELSTVTIVTSDNPRREDPDSIIAQIMAGVLPGRTVYSEVDRRRAIAKGLLLAERDDVVLIAGKGHEDYQVIGEQRYRFDDREEVERFLQSVR